MTSNSNSWQITDDEDIVPVRAAKKKSSPNPDAMKTFSRKPAALFGILIVTLLGAVFLYDANEIIGQVAGNSVQVTISASGLEPVVLSVSPGTTITWKNEQEIPHYLLSDSLCDAAKECMTTSTMFTGDETSYTIPTSVVGGAYTYFSPTDPNIVGTISIGGAAVVQDPVPPAEDTPPIAPSSGINPVEGVCYSPSDCIASEHCSSLDDGVLPGTCVSTSPAIQEQAQNTEVAAEVDPDAPPNPLLEAIQRQLELDRTQGTASTQQTTARQGGNGGVPGVPQNPYTVGTTDGSNPPTGGNPLVASQQHTEQIYSANLQKPFRQADTGTGTWVAAAMSMLALWFVYTRAKKTIGITSL